MGQSPALRKRGVGRSNAPRAGPIPYPGDPTRLINSLRFDKTMSRPVRARWG